MTRILLSHPLFLALNPDEQAASSPYFPLGLLYLAAYVRDQGHEVAIFDGTFASGPQDFVDQMRAYTPDVVGISAVRPNREMALRLASLAKEHEVTVIMGGPDPTYDPSPYLAHPQVDIVVHHEGEQTINALLDLHQQGRLTLETLASEPGVAYRSSGKITINQPRPPIENLDELPLPARDLIDMPRYLDVWQMANGYSSLSLSTSRGCPYGCQWCRDAVHGQDLRQRSPESVASEMKALKATYDVDRLRIVDDVDGISRDWLEAWEAETIDQDAVIPFEALNDLKRQDIPLLDVRDSL